jgi:hypothetical protein
MEVDTAPKTITDMTLDDMIKKDKRGGRGGLRGNRGGDRGGRRGRGGDRTERGGRVQDKQGGRPRFNDKKFANRDDLFKARKGGNAIQKTNRGN